MSADANVSALLRRWAERTPERDAIVGRDGSRVSFAGLEARCERIAAGLRELGLGEGDRTLLFVPPGHELIAVTHALFRVGAVPVLIDPGMGRQALLACVRRIRPRAMVGIPRAHVARTIFPAAFRSVELAVTVGRRLGWPGVTLEELESRPQSSPPLAPTPAASEAAILFTSGSTGPPKGVVYTHGIFQAQLAALSELYDLQSGEVDVACFPLFALFDNALGMTSVFPELDASRPGTCDPRKIHAALEREAATFTFGSPAIWRRVLAWAEKSGARFSTLRRVTIAGAPVAPRLIAGLRALLPPGGEVHTPYGATEALPVANLSGADLAAGIDARTERGEGTCVGWPAPNVDVRILRICDQAYDAYGPELDLPHGQVGEICVRGPVATPAYKFDEEATQLAKIPDPDGGTWHRMGDVGRFDEDGRLWFLGRKSHRLETAHGVLFPVPFENVCNTLPGVRRTALVGVGERGHERPHLIVEAEPGSSRSRLRELVTDRAEEGGAQTPLAGVLFKRSFPVDARHNAKIKRGELKRWAEGKLGLKALVTGGGGFLGKAVVEALLAAGHAVRSLSRKCYPELEALGAETVQADLEDRAAVLAAARDRDTVFHVAARTGVWGPRARYFGPNVEGTRNVLAACREAGVARLVHTSSPSVCFDGKSHVRADGSLPYAPRFLCAYPETKAIAERLVLGANGQHGLATCALRPHLIFGPGDPHLIPRLLERGRRGKLAIVGPGDNEVSMTFVDNAAAAHLDAARDLRPDAPHGGKAYFIAQEEPVRLWDWIAHLFERLEVPPVRRRVPLKVAYGLGATLETIWRATGRESEPPMTRFVALQLATSHSYDLGPARRDFGYRERVGMAEATERLVASLAGAER